MTPAYVVKLHNSFTRRLDVLEPIVPGQVGVYCCGPTVYDTQHIGNFKTFIFEDVLVRTLRFAGYKVKHVMNITDVGHLTSDADEGEDKMIVAMRREGKSAQQIADFYTAKFFEDWDKLNLVRPDVVAKATQHIPEMIALIQVLEKRGFAYASGGNIYFNVAKFKPYGRLAGLDLKKLKAGARVNVDANKKNPYDFVLWFTKSKFAGQEMLWESPWGTGYPGWHIECSAMSMKYLGEQFDIHCGGADHIPVHHTNEIAQSEAATGKKWVSIWMHSQFMMQNQEKMSKSKGGFMILDDLIQHSYEPACYRMLLLGSHYRSHLNFSWEAMDNAKRNLEKLKNLVLSLKEETLKSGQAAAQDPDSDSLDQFRNAICDDLNTPQALAHMWKIAADKDLSSAQRLGLLLTMDRVFGLGMDTWEAGSEEIPAEVQDLATRRDAARREKNWAEADRLRQEISALGYLVEDSAQGAVLKKMG
ncbi:MAG: cysteine--tRNA ligase [Deltaproteobacteria bacterium]|nr:cysteine--tRNA ligase [Deltaproteobacteria bacterium]